MVDGITLWSFSVGSKMGILFLKVHRRWYASSVQAFICMFGFFNRIMCAFTLLTALKNNLKQNNAAVSSFPCAINSKWHPPGKLKPNPLTRAILEVVVQFIKWILADTGHSHCGKAALLRDKKKNATVVHPPIATGKLLAASAELQPWRTDRLLVRQRHCKTERVSWAPVGSTNPAL